MFLKASQSMAFTSAVAIFLGSFLLFLVQPVIGKMILPWFGGTPAVWTTCMLFFQVLLLAGYAYAALLARIASPVRQATIHIALLSLSLLLLPITPSASWKPPDGEYPAIRILLMLAGTVGWPYFLLSATSPLVQAWFARAYPTRSPYRLYALSNIGSLGALLIYPFVVEPALTTSQQGTLWSVAFAVFVIGCCMLAFQLWQIRAALQLAETKPQTPSANHKQKRKQADDTVAGPTRYDRWIWLSLPALASLMLLCVTNHLCQDVAVIPFLWIVPLALYLVSLIICFDRDWWYSRRWFSLGAMVMILVASDLAFLAFLEGLNGAPSTVPLWRFLRYDVRVTISVYLGLFFFVCMVCHGEVVRRRPAAAKLTEFYLSVSAGGALGGFIVAVICPLVFTSFLELKIGLVVSFIVAMSVFLSDLNLRGLSAAHPKKAQKKSPAKSESIMPVAIITIVSILALFAVFSAQVATLDSDSKLSSRNFYGTLKVREWFEDEPEHFGRAMYHGAILHGFQYITTEKENLPTTYYTEKSGIGRTIAAKRATGQLKIGVVGLGVGTIAAYGQPGDTFRFYEINPHVIDLARQPFTFLSKSPATVDVISGDARLSLEREEPQQFDVLVLDAFSGDSIPVHLLTLEAMDIYLRHMKPDGIIALHVSNRYVNLDPVVDRLAATKNLQQWKITHEETQFLELAASDWILLTSDSKSLDVPELQSHGVAPKSWPQFVAWTDDYNNLFELLQPSF